MITYQQAQEIIKHHVKLFETEFINIDEALGRVLAKDIYAKRDLPPFNRSAMDGFAFNFLDIQNNIDQFIISETIFAGQKGSKVLKSGFCYKIMTGAAVPESADVVIRNEDCTEINTIVKVDCNKNLVKKYQNIALKGQDIHKGEIAINAYTKVSPSLSGYLASLGLQIIEVFKIPNIAIVTTGNEVVTLDEEANDYQIYNSNLYLIKSLLLQHQIKPKQIAHIIDDETILESDLKKYVHNDVLILTGGVSAGEADFVPAVLKKLKVEILFHKVAIKPGKPILCGKLPNGGLVFALPGNPLSCLVTFKLFVEVYLKACCNINEMNTILLPSKFNRTKKTSFDEFFPVVINHNGTLNEVKFNGSGDNRLAGLANALGLQTANQTTLNKNDLINCIILD